MPNKIYKIEDEDRKLQSVQVVGLGQACVDYVGRVPTYPVEDSKMELEGLLLLLQRRSSA